MQERQGILRVRVEPSSPMPEQGGDESEAHEAQDEVVRQTPVTHCQAPEFPRQAKSLSTFYSGSQKH